MVLSEFQEAGLICVRLKQTYQEELAEARRQHLEDAALVFEELVMLALNPVHDLPIKLLNRFHVLPDPRPVMEKCFRRQPFTAHWNNNLGHLLWELDGTEELRRFRLAALMAKEDAAVKYLHDGVPFPSSCRATMATAE